MHTHNTKMKIIPSLHHITVSLGFVSGCIEWKKYDAEEIGVLNS